MNDESVTQKSNLLLYWRFWRWPLLYSPRGIISGIGILMGLGRLFQVGLTATLTFGPSLLFALALLTGGLALLLSLPLRLRLGGRLAASYAVACFAFMGVGTWGSTAALLYLFCALIAIIEATTRKAYEC